MKKKKKKNVQETLEIINEIIDYNKDAQKFFIVHQKLIKKSKSKFEESIAERTKLRTQKFDTIAKIYIYIYIYI